MLRAREIILIALFVSAIWIVALALQSDPSAYYQICETNQNGGKESCSPHHVPYVIAWYIGYWFDKSAAIIAAFATVAIAWFTLTLKRSTDKLFKATSESVEVAESALTDLERPFIVIEGISSDINFYLSHKTGWDEERHNPSFTLTVVNYGRTPGNIDFAAIIFVVSETIPKQITKLHLVTADPDGESIEIIIGSERTYNFPKARCGRRFTHADSNAIRAGTHHLYCHGLFTYIDIFGKDHTTEFCRRYWPERGEWPPEGGRERNHAS